MKKGAVGERGAHAQNEFFYFLVALAQRPTNTNKNARKQRLTPSLPFPKKSKSTQREGKTPPLPPFRRIFPSSTPLSWLASIFQTPRPRAVFLLLSTIFQLPLGACAEQTRRAPFPPFFFARRLLSARVLFLGCFIYCRLRCSSLAVRPFASPFLLCAEKLPPFPPSSEGASQSRGPRYFSSGPHRHNSIAGKGTTKPTQRLKNLPFLGMTCVNSRMAFRPIIDKLECSHNSRVIKKSWATYA